MHTTPATAPSGWKRFVEFLLWIPFIVLSTVVVLGTLLVGLGYWLDSTNRRTSEKISGMVTTAYREAASRGVVPAPAAEPNALLAGGKCAGVPMLVRVRTTAGEKIVYLAEGHPSTSLKAETWTFRSLATKDPQSIGDPQ